MGNKRKIPDVFWQINSGSDGREYSEQFFDFGVAFIGPGELGHYQNKKDDYKREYSIDKDGNNNLNSLDTFSQSIREGNGIILKTGTNKMKAVGIIKKVQEKIYHWSELFGDMDGWDTQHFVFVDWFNLEKDFDRKLARTLMCCCNQESVISFIKSNWPNLSLNKPKYTEVQILNYNFKDNKIDDEDLKSSLKNEIDLNERQIEKILRIKKLSDYYYHNAPWEEIREHETRTFLVVPLLKALGWKEEQIKIEYYIGKNKGRIDILCFNGCIYEKRGKVRSTEDVILLIETKGFSQGLTYAEDQGKQYADNFEECKTLTVTNGYVYKIYKRNNNNEFILVAYLNLIMPTKNYLLNNFVKGAVDAFKYLLPQKIDK